ncbi:2-amino-4-hydroxy-6-hydroxymethyldihydropteridine diphosphokinase [Hallella mizrahii]|uniref:2-amino-4-hydroxy-6-hydroxymethyldihydropteridine pyrophosphokinase n=1 Tax=Hallella mizrahii TaxID=2606637 RepID=A0A7K0KCS7_9BACT|nr:2-amino-4-hydroxy-6-hydroxymethyldihydropteridine diphosphokinase [Hallella mizrahii]MST83737.1 2-amino-4-hydroxy-6-hydroxymethyldihydropteridine diphosphokinase [Hallella mizrahii]
MKESHSVILCLGSNADQEANIQQAQQLLRNEYASIDFTPSIWTEPVGVVSPPYLNCLATMSIKDSFSCLHDKTKAIERLMHSSREERKDNIVRIDIDILSFDHKHYHEDDWNRDYVKQLIEVLPAPLHLI